MSANGLPSLPYCPACGNCDWRGPICNVCEKNFAAPPEHEGAAYRAVAQAINEQHEWTVAIIRMKLRERGITVPAKKIYNAIGYLTRTGRITRLGYGRYRTPAALAQQEPKP